jgi:hypothetical protein
MFDKIVEMADKLGVIQSVRQKLLTQPDPAASHLVVALDEVYKIYIALEGELVAYLSLWIDAENPELRRDRIALMHLEGGEIAARVARARGSCTKITNIYDRYLTGWFKRVLSPTEAAELAVVFRDMHQFDSQMVNAIEEMAAWLTTEAETTLDLVTNGDLAGASARVLRARVTVKDDRRAIAAAMRDLTELQVEFIAMSGAIGPTASPA